MCLGMGTTVMGIYWAWNTVVAERMGSGSTVVPRERWNVIQEICRFENKSNCCCSDATCCFVKCLLCWYVLTFPRFTSTLNLKVGDGFVHWAVISRTVGTGLTVMGWGWDGDDSCRDSVGMETMLKLVVGMGWGRVWQTGHGVVEDRDKFCPHAHL